MAGPFYVSASGNNGAGTSWETAKQTFEAGVALLTNPGETLYVDSTHNENVGASKTFTFPSTGGPCFVISATYETTTPAAGAKVNSNGSHSFTFGGNVAMYGMTFTAGQTAQSQSGARLFLNASGDSYQRFEKCGFSILSTSNSALMSLGAISTSLVVQGKLVLHNCTLTYSSTGQAIGIAGGFVEIINLTLAGTAPTTLFSSGNDGYGFHQIKVSGSDFSSVTNLASRAAFDEPRYLLFTNCKIPSTIVTGTAFLLGSMEIEVQGCANSTDDNWQYWWYGPEGSVIAQSSVYFTTGGASSFDGDGNATPYSLMMTPASTDGLVSKGSPLYSPWIYVNVQETGNKTFSVQVGHKESAVLTSSEVWLEVEFLGGAAAAGVPQSQIETSAPVTGDASSVSRDFMAAGSNLTDNGGTDWTDTGSNEVTKSHTLSKQVAIDEKGYARVRVGLGKDTGDNPIYVDPKVNVS